MEKRLRRRKSPWSQIPQQRSRKKERKKKEKMDPTGEYWTRPDHPDRQDQQHARTRGSAPFRARLWKINILVSVGTKFWEGVSDFVNKSTCWPLKIRAASPPPAQGMYNWHRRFLAAVIFLTDLCFVQVFADFDVTKVLYFSYYCND